MIASEAAPTANACQLRSRKCLTSSVICCGTCSGIFNPSPRNSIQLSAKNYDSDAAGESGDDRIGEKLQQPAHLERSDRDQHHARHHRRERETAVAVLSDDGEEDRNKRAGGSCDLETRAAEKRHCESCNYASPQPLLWRSAGGNGETNGERQRNDSNGEPGRTSLRKNQRVDNQ